MSDKNFFKLRLNYGGKKHELFYVIPDTDTHVYFASPSIGKLFVIFGAHHTFTPDDPREGQTLDLGPAGQLLHFDGPAKYSFRDPDTGKEAPGFTTALRPEGTATGKPSTTAVA